jgi:hypothetical protein
MILLFVFEEERTGCPECIGTLTTGLGFFTLVEVEVD